MRKHRQEITDNAVLEKILASEIICRLGFLDGKRPYILPFNYGYREGKIYIHAAPEGKKLNLIRTNPEVCFEIEHGVEILKYDTACAWSTRYRSIVGYGKLEILEEDSDKQFGLEVIMAQHGAPQLVDFKQENMERIVILSLKIESMSGKQSANWQEE